ILSPSPQGSAAAKLFLADNSKFLGNRETVEVYWNYGKNDEKSPPAQTLVQNAVSSFKNNVVIYDETNDQNSLAYSKKYSKSPQLRNVFPQQQALVPQAKDPFDAQAQQFSKLSSSEAEFRQLIGDETEGTLARFLNNRLNVLCWCRSGRDTNLVFGAELS